jgi:hypothetical protein
MDVLWLENVAAHDRVDGNPGHQDFNDERFGYCYRLLTSKPVQLFDKEMRTGRNQTGIDCRFKNFEVAFGPVVSFVGGPSTVNDMIANESQPVILGVFLDIFLLAFLGGTALLSDRRKSDIAVGLQHSLRIRNIYSRVKRKELKVRITPTPQHSKAPTSFRDFRTALLFMALLGGTLIFLFPGFPEQDSGYHFVMARTAWHQPVYFVDVWARPLYTFAFSGPVLLGFKAARFFALAISLLIAWQTWKLASDLRMERAWLTLPLLLAQPTFFELFTDLLTEPLFALIFVVALRLHLRGRIKIGMAVASLLPLARPEGAFLCLLWGCWVLSTHQQADRRASVLARVASLSLLAPGTILWWTAAFTITGDPLFIAHNWPLHWQNGTYGHGSILSYSSRAWEFAGPLLVLFLLIGLLRLLWMKKYAAITTAWLLFFLLHSVFRAYGLFGEAGYPRYMVSLAPATAIITLLGWNTLASWQNDWFRRPRLVIGPIILASSLVISFLYMDAFIWTRDFVAIREMVAWFEQNPSAVRCFIWSNVGMCIQTNNDLSTAPALTEDRQRNLQVLQQAPPQTLVFWDDNVGPKWFGLSAREIQDAGFQLLRVRQYTLPGLVMHGEMGGWQLTRRIELSLLYKP